MNNAPMFTAAQTRAYLDLLGLEGTLAPNLDNLHKLVRAHHLAVPFSSLDIQEGQTPPELTIDSLFEKVVARKRGGYCFELNFLFKNLLASLGYEVRTVCCRVIMGMDKRGPILHRGTLVFLDEGACYVDVGFGGPVASGALLLREGEDQCVQGETYRLRKLDESWWAIDRYSGARELQEGQPTTRTELEFCTASFEDIDFMPMNQFCSQPGSFFYDNNILNLRTPTGTVSLMNDVLTHRNNGTAREQKLTDSAALNSAIEEYFGFKP